MNLFPLTSRSLLRREVSLNVTEITPECAR